MGIGISIVPAFVLVFTSFFVPPSPVGAPLIAAAAYAHLEQSSEVMPPDAEAVRIHNLTVLSFNIHHGRGADGKIDLERIAQVIQDSGADLVVLNEVDQGTRRSGGVDQPAELARLTGMTAVFEKNIDFQDGAYGNAVLSRLPITAQANHHLESLTVGEQRGCLDVRVTLGAESDEPVSLRLLGTHWDYRPSNAERMASARKVLKLVAAEPTVPTLLMGDLNDVPGSPVLDLLRGRFVNADEIERFTYPAIEPTKQIDYVLHSPADRFMIDAVHVIPNAAASDHRPLVVNFSITAH